MKAFALVVCLAGSAVAFYEPAYNVGPSEPAWAGYLGEPSQRLFWGNSGAGTNQVGGTGLWSHFTNKFPFLATMFGRLEQPGYQPAAAYGPPAYQQQLNFVPQYFPAPSQGRDVSFTDDSVIITPPQPAPEPEPGYHYAPPQQRFQLPQK